ncbi:MAG: transketolase [Candidatus Babeliaceae bacterium]|jgi:transketolase
MSQKNNYSISFLEHIAYGVRVDILRATTNAGSGHPTSCLSAADIGVALFFYGMHCGDKFVLSKGHAAPLLYALYKQLGIISDIDLMNMRTFDSVLEGHPTPRCAQVCVATGSLGQGLSIGLGMVIGQRVTQHQGYVFVMLGDAELAEGSNWEAAEVAAHYQGFQLVAFVDVNRWGQSDQTLYGYRLERIQAQWEAFGWCTFVIDGHSMKDLCALFDYMRNNTSNQPTVIIARTYKGHGLNGVIEDYNGYHGKVFSAAQLPALLQALKHNYAHADLYAPTAADLSQLKITKKIHEPMCTRVEEPCTLPVSRYQLGELCATRKAFGQALAAAGASSKSLIVFDGDVKNSTFTELFDQQYPERFFQSFVAEQNMVGMAMGAAVSGTIPVAATFACFLTRAHDQLRMAGISRSPIRLVGSHAGVSIGQDGPSQMGLEDIALFRSIPDSIILYPCDAVSAYYCTNLILNAHENVSYLRTTRGETPVIYNNDEQFVLGGCKVLRSSEHDTVCIIAAGVTVFEALAAYDLCKKKNIFIRVIDCYSIKPLPVDELIIHARACGKKVITVEDHYLQGGMGESIAYALRNEQCVIECLAVTQLPRSGTPEQLRAFEHIDAAAIVAMVEKVII